MYKVEEYHRYWIASRSLHCDPLECHWLIWERSEWISWIDENVWSMPFLVWSMPLQWRHNGRDSVSNQQPHDCLLNRLFRRSHRKHHSSASLPFVRGIHQGPVNSPHEWPVTRKTFPFDDVIMLCDNCTRSCCALFCCGYINSLAPGRFKVNFR